MLYNSWGKFLHRFNFTNKGLFKEFCEKIKWCILRGSKSSEIKKLQNFIQEIQQTFTYIQIQQNNTKNRWKYI